MNRSRKKGDALLRFTLSILLTILLSACGEAIYLTFETGSIAFSVEWLGAPQQSSGRYAAALDCDAAGVATVVAEVYDESSLYLTSGGPWLCSAHTGTIQNVPVGSDRTVVVLAKDINGDVLYRGEKSGIAVSAGDTTDAGTIVVELFSPPFDAPVLVTPTHEETVTRGSYSFEWNLIAGALQYQIQVSTDSNFPSTVIDETVTTTSYTPIAALSAGTYYWRVRAEDSYGNESAWSEVWSFTVSTEPGAAPSAPTNVTATPGNGQVTISWDAVSGATSYNIYWAIESGVSKDTYDGNIEDITSTSYTHTVLTSGTTYYYVITAENSYGESDDSSEVSATPNAAGTAPSAPTSVIATAGDGQITISWDSVSGATSYDIYWATYSGVSKADYEGIISNATSPYTHTGLTNGTTYYYVVTAENSYGESDDSSEVSATPSGTGTAPSAPTSVIATAGDGQVTISWHNVSEAASYSIYWSTWSGVSKNDYEGKIEDIISTSYLQTGLTNDTTYYYTVTAKNDYGESDESSEVDATPASGNVLTYLSGNFEGGLGSWWVDNGIWEVGTPTSGPNGAYSGSDAAGTVLDGNYPNTDSRLISPSILLPTIGTGDEIHLRFWHWFSFGSYDAGRVQISEEISPGVWSAWATLSSYSGGSGGVWTYPLVDLSGYAGKKVRIGFLLDNGGGSYVGAGWYVDDVSVAFGQTTVLSSGDTYTYGFEGGLGDWSAHNGSWEVDTPTSGPNGAYSGSDAAATVLDGNYPNTDSRLISPSILLPAIGTGEEIHLRFWHWFSFGSYDAGRVQISEETSAGVWSAYTTLSGYSGSSGGVWTYPLVDLSAYAGKKVRIGFLLDNGGGSYVGAGWYVDDVLIETP